MINENLYMPLMWGVKTRHKTKLNKISFLIIDIFPSAYFSVLYGEQGINAFVMYVCSFVFMYCFYEIGYIMNDLKTIMKEKHPTQRLDIMTQEWCLRHLRYLIGVRLLVAIVLAFIVLVDDLPTLVYVVLSSCFILFSYYLHNNYRGNINVLTMIMLGIAKYLIPILISLKGGFDLRIIFVIALVCIFPHTFEYCQDKGIISKLNVERIKLRFYYMFLLIILCMILKFSGVLINIDVIFVLMIAVYRFLGVMYYYRCH